MGPYLSAPKREKEFENGEGKKCRYSAASMQGWRNTMEDTHIACTKVGGDDDTCLFGVFDGHGGAEVAQFVKKHFQAELEKNEKFKKRENLGEALIETFIQMDKLMITKEGTRELFALRDPTRENQQRDCDLKSIYAGCTANVCLIYKNQMYVANSGDSRSVICSKNVAFPMSSDHKPNDVGELNRIRAAGGFVAEGRVNGNLNLSRAMGDFEYKNVTEVNGEQVYPSEPAKTMITVVPDITSKNLIATDKFLLMGCDGIWDCKSNQEYMEFVNARLDKGLSLEETLRQLLDNILAVDCSDGIGCDNMTVILVLLSK